MRFESVEIVPNPVITNHQYIVRVRLPYHVCLGAMTHVQLKEYLQRELMLAQNHQEISAKTHKELSGYTHAEVRMG